jgi:hypothetical protein
VIGTTLHHLIQHWRIDLTTLISLALGSTVLISLFGYEADISNQSLHRTLTLASPSGRSLLITGSLNTFDTTLYKNLQTNLGAAFKERIEIRYAALQADPQTAAMLNFNRIDVYSFDSIGGHVYIVEGRLPAPMRLSEAIGSAPPQVEAVIGARAAEQAGYQIGDRLTASGSYHRFKIVGIVEPLDENDDAWGGDLSAFQVTGGMAPEDRALPLIIAPLSMRSNLLRPIFPHQIYWRVTLNHEHILSERVENLRTNLINFEAQAGTRGAVVTSDLIRILDDYQVELSPVQTVFSLLGLQSATILLLALAALATTKDQSLQIEWSTASARGASLWQIAKPIALKAFVVSVSASLICSPGLAQLSIFLGSRDDNSVVSYPLPGNTWLIAVVLTGAGWLVLTLPTLFFSHHDSIRNHLLRRPWIQRYSLDMYLFAFGSLLSWQLRQSGSFLSRQLANNTRLLDPLLIAGPSLMLVACAMLAIRLLPILARPIARFAKRLPGSVLHLGFLHLTHDSRGAGWVLLLTIMVSAQGTFNQIFADTLVTNPSLVQVPSLGLGLSRALWLNTITLILFTVSLFFLLGLFIQQKRSEEFRILRTLGVAQCQGRFALNIEYLPSLLMGVLLGTFLGLGLLSVLLPYLTQTFGQAVIDQPAVDLWALARLDAGLLSTFGIALLLPMNWDLEQRFWTSLQAAE